MISPPAWSADKVSVNSGAIKNPAIISAAAQRYGNQCVVLSADIKRVDGKFKLFTKGGRENTGIDALDWLEHGVKNGAGELVVNSCPSSLPAVLARWMTSRSCS